MVVQNDFEMMFDSLDLERRGYLTTEEIRSFFYSLFYKPINDLLVKHVLKAYGGASSEERCTKKCFENVLFKLEEDRSTEESAYWDFIALDKDGTRLVSVKNCLLLARMVKDDDFSLEVWQDWLNSRSEPSSSVAWCEFQRYLYCSLEQKREIANEDEACSREEQSLVDNEMKKLQQKYNDFKEMLEEDEDYMTKLQQDQEMYYESVKYESQRLLGRWNIGGAEAVIFDDGSEMQLPIVSSEEKNTLSTSDLLSGLDTKYDMFRKLVMEEMAKAHAALEHPERDATTEEVEHILHEISKRERKLRKTGAWEQYASIPGANVNNRFTPLAVMGETPDSYNAKWTKAENRFNSLRAEGKTATEINKMYEAENLDEIKGSSSSADILIHLAKRQKEEKDYILQTVRRATSTSVEGDQLALYSALHRQCLRIEEFNNFQLSATSACLAERIQMPDFEKYNPDRTRQEKLSQTRIQRGEHSSIGKNIPSPSKPNVSHSKDLGLVDSWLEITRVLAQKHTAEAEMLTHFILSPALQEHSKSLKNKTEKELVTLHRGLTNEHQRWRDETSSSGGKDEKMRNQRLDLLISASALYLENLSRKSPDRDQNELGIVLLSHLQVSQDVECEKLFAKMKNMNAEELYVLRKDLYKAARDECFENVVSLLLSAVEVTEEEKDLMNIILAKYDELRTKLFEAYVRRQNVTDDEEKKKTIDKLRAGEERFRKEGNHSSLARLCKKTLKIEYPLQEVLGPDFSRFKQEAEYHLEEIETSGKRRKLINELPTKSSEDPDDPRGNLISELHLRYEDEVEAILEDIRARGKEEKEIVIAAESAWQQWEMLRFTLDDEFVHAALGLGLCERTKIGRGKVKLRQDNTRYVRLAQERLMMSRSLNTKSLQRMSSKTSAVQSSLRRVLLCHGGEWTKLYDFLTDDSAEELREAAGMMNEDERTARVAEIDAKRRRLDAKSSDWQEDLTALLEEAAAIKYVSRMQNLNRLSGEGSGGLTITPTDVHVSIMADLQEEHDIDGFRWFQKALEDPEAAGKIKDLVQAESRGCTNIFNVLCKYEGQADDDEILQALEDKYDSLRDKLLAEALMKQLGAKAWSEMSERERQDRLLKLKLEERRLRKEGRYDELAKLLGDAFAADERLRAKLGMSKEEYERRLKERLANRKKGGLDSIAEEEEDLVEPGEGDPLSDLASRYEDERDALMRMLAGQDDRYMSERERQRELARLQRELRKSQREEMFGAAALVLGLAERNAEMDKRLESDRKRQEELARQRIAALKLRKKGKNMPMPAISEEDEEILRDGTKSEMMDAVLKKLELLHEAERAWLVHILTSQSELKPEQTGFDHVDTTKVITLMTRLQLSDKLQKINARLPGNQVNVNGSRVSLIEAGFFREALLAHHELQKSDEHIDKDILDVKMLALLQEIQDQKSRSLTDDMPNMEKDKLIQLQEDALKWVKEGTSENIPTTMFALSSEDTMLAESLEGTHNAILAALVEKALVEKFGNKKWNSMKESERDRLIAENLEKLKKLMAEGRTDEALGLLGSSAKEDPDILLSLFGIKSEEEEKKRLEEERLERRRQRIANGMSEEEADRLMHEEEEADAELLKKRRKNILDTLQYDLDAQKAAILRQKANADERLDAERRRQLELAKLRLQERLSQRESDVQAVAHVLALSKMHDDQLEKEKQRQLELARKRLEAFRKGRGKKLEEEIIPLKLPDTDDSAALIDIIIREMEAKHAQERSVVMHMMMTDAAPGSKVRKKAVATGDSEMKHRKTELRELRRQWRNDDPASLAETGQDQMEILIEATAINLELAQKDNEINSEEGAQEEILAILQKQQMSETSHLVNDLPEKNPATLRMIAQVQWRARAERWLDNVAESLLQESGKETNSEEDEVIRALEDKYDAVKDKLIAEALMRQMGEKDWQALSERERQKKVTALKLQERKLRQEGKMDEAAALISAHIKSDEELARLLGEAKLSQEEQLKRRLEQRKKLKEERMAAGLAVDDDTLDTELAKQEEEEKKQKRKNVLLLLEHNLDEEKEALLANLRRQDESIDAERRRQMELAHLKRQQRQIQREDRFNAAAMIFNQAKQAEGLLAANLESNRQRQLALAKERLASRKAAKEQREAVRRLFDFESVVERLKHLEKAEEDSATAPDRLLREMDATQVDEREMLLLLLQASEMDSDARMQVSSLSTEQIRAEKEKIATERKNWREKRFGDLLQSTEDTDDDGRQQRRREALARSLVEQNTNFKRYMILELEALRRSQPEQNQDFVATKNEMTVKWLAEVQTAQDTASEAVHTLIGDKSDEVLDMITYGQRKARVESWNDNMNKVVMGLLPPGQMLQPMDRQSSSVSFGSEERAVEEAEKNMKSLDEELDEQRKELEKKKLGGEQIDVEAAMAQLEQQYNTKRQQYASDLERQKQKIQERLAARREQRAEMEYEAYAAAAMVFTAEKRLQERDAKAAEQKSRQRNLMQERLEARRKRRKELEDAQQPQEDEDTVDAAPRLRKPMAPPAGLQRQKTIIPDLSEEQKAETLEKLKAMSMENLKKIEEERRKQQQRVKEQLEKRNMNKVENRAMALLQTFEREKTIVLDKHKQAMERQKTMLQERVQNIRTEKTKTMREKGSEKVRDFEKLVNPEESEGMSKDEKMKLAAENLQKKFDAEKASTNVLGNEAAGGEEKEQLEVPDKDGDDHQEESPSTSASPASTPKPLSQRDRERIMRNRMSLRKQKRKEEHALEEAQQEESNEQEEPKDE